MHINFVNLQSNQIFPVKPELESETAQKSNFEYGRYCTKVMLWLALVLPGVSG